MKNTTDELISITDSFTVKFNAIPESEFSAKPLPHKWSKKEVVGHLIDSAQNNLRRFICCQHGKAAPKMIYEQDFWVSSIGYQQMNKEDVIRLWQLVNRQVAQVLRYMPEDRYSFLCDTGREAVQLHTLQWLAEDYVKHLKHHLNQVIPQSFDITYP